MVKRFVLLNVLLFLIIVGCEAPYGYLGDEPTAACSAQCQSPPLGFEGPVLLWAGDPAEVPACPEQAPEIVFEGYEGLNNAPVECAPCECSQPRCKLPAGVIVNPNYACPDDGLGVLIPVSASWDGTCVAFSPPYPELVRSDTIPGTTEEPCAPAAEVPEITALSRPFTIRARACGAEAKAPCQHPGRSCTRSDQPLPPGFRRCLVSRRPEEASCPAEYPDKVSFFAELTDNRGCSPCTCTQTAQSECRAYVLACETTSCGGGCSGGQVILYASICGASSSQWTYRSLMATWLTNIPGACTAGGGAPTGDVALSGAQTFCCEEPAVGAEDDPG